jgi:hypothetical protein
MFVRRGRFFSNLRGGVVGRFAKVDVRVWTDEKVREMTPIPPCGQGLWMHLLVSRFRSSIPGLLCVGEAALAEDCGWSLEAFRKAFAEASSKGLVKADWKARFVWLPNAFRYNSPESPNVVKSWRIPWDEAPDCPLKREAYHALKVLLEGLVKGFQEAFAKSCREPSGKPWANQEQDPEQEQEQENTPSACAPARGTTDDKIHPREAHELVLCLKIAVEREQPERGTWAAEPFGHKNAQDFLRGFGDDIEAALETIEQRIVLFAKDPEMSPWTVKKFADKYNGIGLQKVARLAPTPTLRTGHGRAEDYHHTAIGEQKL